MKNWVFFVILILVITVGSGAVFFKHQDSFTFLKNEKSEDIVSDTINFYQWEEYIPEEILLDFEEEYGIHVNLILFSDDISAKNEIIKNPEKYDLYVAGDNQVKELISLGLLEEINKNEIENFNNIDSEFLNRPYDFENIYSIPYAYGTTGIMYNSKYFNETPNVEDFFKTKYNNKNGIIIDSDVYIYFLSRYVGIEGIPKSVRDYVIMNDFFKEQKKFTFFGDYEEIRNKMIDEEIWFSAIYESEYFMSFPENNNLIYGLPNGSLLWIDNMVIPKDAKNRGSAKILIDYILRPENSIKIMEYSYTLTPIKWELTENVSVDLIEHRDKIMNSDLVLYSNYEENHLYFKFKEDVEKFFLGVQNE